MYCDGTRVPPILSYSRISRVSNNKKIAADNRTIYWGLDKYHFPLLVEQTMEAKTENILLIERVNGHMMWLKIHIFLFLTRQFP